MLPWMLGVRKRRRRRGVGGSGEGTLNDTLVLLGVGVGSRLLDCGAGELPIVALLGVGDAVGNRRVLLSIERGAGLDIPLSVGLGGARLSEYELLGSGMSAGSNERSLCVLLRA